MNPERRDRNQAQKFEVAAEKLRIFRERYGEPQLPRVGTDERLAFVEVEDRITSALPWVPVHIRKFMADQLISHGSPTNVPGGSSYRYLYMGIFPNSEQGWIQKAEAILESYYGTAATATEIAEAFSLKGLSAVEKNVRSYFLSFLKTYNLDRDPLYRLTIRKLSQPEIFSPQAGVETIKIPQDIWVYHERHCLPEVEEIDRKLVQGDFIILDGPFGVGKTFNVAYPLFRQRRAAGYTVENVDGQAYYSQYIEKALLPELLQGSRRYLAIDEFASILRQDEKGTLKLLKHLHNQKVEVLLVNSGRTQQVRSSIANWMVRKGADMGIYFSIHRLKTTHISPDLAEQYLRNINRADKALVDFVLDPANKALLSPSVFLTRTSGCRTLNELREELKDSVFRSDLIPGHLYAGRGGSKEDMVRVLTNIGLVSPSTAKWLDSIADYN